MTYKKEGGGLQYDYICEDGYTFTFYFINQRSPKKYIDQYISLFQSFVLSIIDQLKDQNHYFGLDNIYKSTKL